MLQGLARSREARLQIGAVALIVAAILVNLLQLDLKSGRHQYHPLSRYETADITKIAKTRTKLKKRFGLFFELGKKFPGSTLIVPPASRLDSAPHSAFVPCALSYGRAAHVVETTLDADSILSELEYRPHIVAQGEDEAGGDWFIAAAGPNANVFIVLKQKRKTVLLDLSLLVKSQDKPRD
jgi:hypothetical protein